MYVCSFIAIKRMPLAQINIFYTTIHSTVDRTAIIRAMCVYYNALGSSIINKFYTEMPDKHLLTK